MALAQRKLDHKLYTVAWLCALPHSELVAAIKMLDERHQDQAPTKAANDHNTYAYGSIGPHNIVIACMPLGQPGIVSASNTAFWLPASFPNLRLCLFVGIGGGIPQNPSDPFPEQDIRLGDVVIGCAPRPGVAGVIQYDYTRDQGPGNRELLGMLDKPHKELLSALGLLFANCILGERKPHEHLARLAGIVPGFSSPPSSPDQLYQSDYNHCEGAVGCDRCFTTHLVDRIQRTKPDIPIFHQGQILSGNSVIKDAHRRDELAGMYPHARCLEMEAAGVVDQTHCLVIRGIADYADSHKNELWQPYAAGTAAAFARELLLTIQPSTVARIDCIQSEEQLKMLRWMSDIDYRSHHDDLSQKILPQSGQWLLESKDFASWRLSTESSILWLHGIPGSGKTKLVSIVIKCMQDRDLTPTAFFYCARSSAEPARAKPIEILCSLLRQLCNCRRELLVKGSIVDYYENHKEEAEKDGFALKRLSLEDCTRMITEFTKKYSATLIVDALDECDEDMRHELLEAFDNILSSSMNNVRIFVSSREDIDIKLHLENCRNIMISAENNNGDIGRFIEQEVDHLKAKRLLLDGNLPAKLQSKLVKTLNEGAQGMFRWVEMSLETLKQIKFRPDFENALGRLPPKLSGLYDIIHSQIKSVETHARSTAMMTFKWLLCSQRLLTAQELIAAVHRVDSEMSMDSDDDDDDDDEEDESEIGSCTENDILRLCRNLVVFDSGRKVFRFAHQSVPEYLLQKPEYTLLEQHTLAAERCLDVYLGDTSSGAALKKIIQANDVFRAYAEIFWPVHYKYVDDNNYHKLKPKMSRFTRDSSGSSSPYLKWILDLRSNSKYRHSHRIFEYWSINEALVVASKNRLDRRICSAVSEPGTYLSVACAFGFLSFLKDCIRSSAHWKQIKFFDPDNHRFILIAVREGHEDVVRLLLTHGGDVNAKSDDGLTALMHASHNGYGKVVQVLLDHGADTNAKSYDGSTALTFASQSGYEKVVQALINQGANINFKLYGGSTALMIASKSGNEKIMQVLLDHGADINVKSYDGFTALMHASQRGHKKVVRLLLKHGANVNAKSEYDGMTALMEASSYGREKVVQLLLTHGADVNIKNEDDHTAMMIASAYGYENLVQLLLDYGATSTAKALIEAMRLASAMNQEEVLRILIIQLLKTRATMIGEKGRLTSYGAQEETLPRPAKAIHTTSPQSSPDRFLPDVIEPIAKD